MIPGELTEAVKTVTSAFADGHNGSASSSPATPRETGPVPGPRTADDAEGAAAAARAAADEARAEVEQARRGILG